MIITSSKKYNFIVIFTAMLVAISINMLASINVSITFLFFYSICQFGLLIRYWIAVCRTFIFDRYGCTVKFLWLSKTYKWEHLKTMSYLDLSNCCRHGQPYKAGAIFCTRKIKKPRRIMPANYCTLVHPFCCIFVYFDPIMVRKRGDLNFPNIYAVEKDIFLKQLSEWNVKSSGDIPD